MLTRFLIARPNTDLLVVVRIIVGLWMAWYGKDVFFEDWFEERKVTWGEDGFGFSNPVLMLYLSKVSQIIFGSFLALGLFTRLSASALIVVMSVAIIIGNDWQIFPYDKGQIAFFYWLFFVVFLLMGGGKYSLDHALFSKQIK